MSPDKVTGPQLSYYTKGAAQRSAATMTEAFEAADNSTTARAQRKP